MPAHLLVAVAELRHVAKVHVGDAAIPEAEDVAGVGVTMEQAKLQQLAQARHHTNTVSIQYHRCTGRESTQSTTRSRGRGRDG